MFFFVGKLLKLLMCTHTTSLTELKPEQHTHKSVCGPTSSNWGLPALRAYNHFVTGRHPVTHPRGVADKLFSE